MTGAGPRRARAAGWSSGPTSRATSCSARAGAAATTSTSTASRPTPSCSPASAARSPRSCASTRRRRSSWRGPSWARCRSRRWRRSRSGLPYVIVRKAAKDYGTGNRLEGVYERRGAASAWSRTWSRRAARCSTAVAALREPRSSTFVLQFAWLTARRAAPRRSPRQACRFTRSSPSPILGVTTVAAIRLNPAPGARLWLSDAGGRVRAASHVSGPTTQEETRDEERFHRRRGAQVGPRPRRTPARRSTRCSIP